MTEAYHASSTDFTPIPQARKGFKSGFVGIVGRPNVGKSTLMNRLIGEKVAITSPVAQTTRNRLQGVLTTPNAQIIFVDTPGIHKPHHLLGEVLVFNAQQVMNSVDLLLFIVDSTEPPGPGDHFIAEQLQRTSVPVLIIANKVDQRSPKRALDLQQSYRELLEPYREPIPVSARTGKGMEKLLTAIGNRLPKGPYYYPPDYLTDQPERFICAELIREQVLLLTEQEIPHSVAVTIESMKVRPAHTRKNAPMITHIQAAIHVERDSQKGILIGKEGRMLKEIGTQSRKRMEKLVDGSIFLELFVKVNPRWRSSNQALKEFGYQRER